MDSYKLARLMLDDKHKKLELQKELEKVDVSACLSEELQVPECGYNCLHLSVMKDDIQLSQQLLDRGVDFLKQGTKNGYTPLHRFIIEQPYNEGMRVANLCGKLRKHPIADLLLNEQVRRNLALNPKSSTGLTHLHIACMVDHSEAVNLFLKAGESVNQTVDSSDPSFAGYTPLHFAIKYSSVNVAKLLIYYEADIHQKDAMGLSPLHKLIQRLMLTADYITMGKSAPLSPLVEELEILEMMVALILITRNEKDLNFVDHFGLTAFHVACTLKKPFTNEDVLEGAVEVNKPLISDINHLWPGWSPLHFAACCSVETVKLLIQHGAEITITNSEGATPLDMSMRRYSPAVIHSILSTKEEYREILLSDGLTKLLDLILAMDNCAEFQSFLQNMPDVNATVPLDSPIWPGYNVLHLAIEMHEKTEDALDYIENELVAPIEDSLDCSYTCNLDEEKNYWKRIVVCLARRCSLVAKNAAGLTPVHLAFQLNKANLVDKLLNSCCSLGENVINESSGLSFLHMACVVGKKNVVERFVIDINTPVKADFYWFGADIHSRVRANSTPLHIALQFDHCVVVEFLFQQKNIDIYASDSLGLTPIHLSIVSQPTAHWFLSNIKNLREVVSHEGLSHLHVAAFADDDKAIKALIRNGANVDVAFQPSNEVDHIITRSVRGSPLYVAVTHGNSKAVNALIEAGADIHAACSNSKYDTPLQAVTWNKFCKFIPQFAKKLRRDKRLKEPLEPCGLTLLHIACASFDFKWAKSLLEEGADPDAQICRDKDYHGDWKGFAALHIVLTRANFVLGNIERLEDMINLLIRHGADVTLQNDEGYSPVLLAKEIANEVLGEKKKLTISAQCMYSIADLLLRSQQSFAINPAMHDNGSTHLHYACKRNSVDIVRKFLKNGIDVNNAKRAVWEIDGGYTSLHYAFSNGCCDVAWLLLEYNADVTVRDVYGNTPFHIALKNNVDDLRLWERIMRSPGANVKTKNYDGVTTLDIFLYSNCISYEQLNFFLDRGCTLELNNELDVNIIGLLLSNADPDDRDRIFSLMIKSCDLIKRIQNGYNAIRSFVGFSPKKEWPKHRRWTVNMYLETIQIFVELGCDINQQNSLGRTALNEALLYCNAQAGEALLLLGADINITDKEDRVPMLSPMRNNYCEQEAKRFSDYLINYAWKMKFAGLKINFINEYAVDQQGMWDAKLEERCRNELKKAEKTKVGAKWTMKDFLSDSGVITEYQTLPRVERHSIDNVFKDHAELRKKFPEFCGVLMAQYNKMLRTTNSQ